MLMLIICSSYSIKRKKTAQETVPAQNNNRIIAPPAYYSQVPSQVPLPYPSQGSSVCRDTHHLQPSQNALFRRQQQQQQQQPRPPANYTIQRPGQVTPESLQPQTSTSRPQIREQRQVGSSPLSWHSMHSGARQPHAPINHDPRYKPTFATAQTAGQVGRQQFQPQMLDPEFPLDPRLFEKEATQLQLQFQRRQALSPVESVCPQQTPQQRRNPSQPSFESRPQQYHPELNASPYLENTQGQSSASRQRFRPSITVPAQDIPPSHQRYPKPQIRQVSYQNTTQQINNPTGPYSERYWPISQPELSARLLELQYSPAAAPPVVSSGLNLPQTAKRISYNATPRVAARPLNNQSEKTIADMEPNREKSNKRPAENVPEDTPTNSESKRRNIGRTEPTMTGNDSVGNAFVPEALASDLASPVIGASVSIVPAPNQENPLDSLGAPDLGSHATGASVSMAPTTNEEDPFNLLGAPEVSELILQSYLGGASVSQASRSSSVSKSQENLQNLPIDFNQNLGGLVGPRMINDEGSDSSMAASSHQIPTFSGTEAASFYATPSQTTPGLSPTAPVGPSHNVSYSNQVSIPTTQSAGYGSQSPGLAFTNAISPATAHQDSGSDTNTYVDPCNVCHGYDLYDLDNICMSCYWIVRPDCGKNKFRDPNAPYLLELRKAERAEHLCNANGHIYCIDDNQGEGRCVNCRGKF